MDEFGGLDKAIEVAKQLAKIPADKGVERVIFLIRKRSCSS